MKKSNRTSPSTTRHGTRRKMFNGAKIRTAPVFVGNSKYEESIPDKYVDVTVGVFFDGTGNNRFNTQSRKDHELKKKGLNHDADSASNYIKIKGSSYEGEFSNVSRMEPAYKKISEEKKIQISVYVEGIGTKRAVKDSDIGYGLGMGSTGVPSRVREACGDIANHIKQAVGGKKLNRLVIDTYGFSRGAAAARHFVAEITKRKGDIKLITRSSIITYEQDHGALGEQLSAKGLEIQGSFSMRFAGLYETVASYGIRHSNDTSDLNLDAVSRARHVFHLVAEDEHRSNFRLTNINEALEMGRTNPEKISAVQKIFPGVHSDIGGGYVHEGNERVTLRTGGILAESILRKEMEHLISEGWYLDHQIPPQITLTSKGNGRNKRYTLKGRRDKLSNRYSYLPLHTMVEYSVKKNIDFEIGKIKGQYAISIKLLKDLKTKFDSYVYDGGEQVTFDNPSDREQIKKLRNKYLHFSAHYDEKRLLGLVVPHAPNLEDGRRTRVIQDG